MNIQLNNFILKKIDKDNPDDVQFISSIFKNKNDKSIEFLGNLSNYITAKTYIIINNNQKIGYFSMTVPVLNRENLTSTSLYYAISEEHRNLGYATNLVEEISNYLFEEELVDMIILTIDNKNLASISVASKLGFNIEFQDQEEKIYTKIKKLHKTIK